MTRVLKCYDCDKDLGVIRFEKDFPEKLISFKEIILDNNISGVFLCSSCETGRGLNDYYSDPNRIEFGD